MIVDIFVDKTLFATIFLEIKKLKLEINGHFHFSFKTITFFFYST